MNNHALPEQKEMAMKYRNVGLGIMGLYDMLVKLGIKYGTENSIKIVDEIMELMFKAAFSASVTLAKEKGSFPACVPSNISKAKIVREHFTESELYYLGLYEHGIRNCSLLSIAPSGSIGTMLNISTGCEPAFALSYTRKTESLNGNKDKYYEVYIGVAKEYMDKYPGNPLPDYFITSADLDWHDRVNMQSALQHHVDTAISSTINLKNEITKEEIEDLYLYAWEKGLKGVTIFRDGCKRAGILTTSPQENEKERKTSSDERLPRGMIIKADDNCIGKKRTLTTGCGTLHCEAFFDPITGDLLETYFSKGSSGGCVDADTEYFNGNKWKKISDYKRASGEKILQYNENGTAELVEPIGYIVNDNVKILKHFTNSYGLDMVLSDDHRMFVYKNYSKYRAGITNNLTSEIVTVSEYLNREGSKTRHVPTTFHFNAPGIPIRDEFIRLLVAVYADGTWDGHKISISLKKERKKVRLRELLKQCDIGWSEKDIYRTEYTYFYLYPVPSISDWFVDKQFTAKWYSCTDKQLEVLIDECIHWDGSIEAGNRLGAYYSSKKEEIDFIQFALARLGYRGTISSNNSTTGITDSYRIRWTKQTMHNLEFATVEDYQTIDGRSYCFTVPSGLLVLRRNNKIFITGNCNQFMIGLSRMVSLSARGGVDIYSIVDQLKSSGTCPSYAVRKATKNDTSLGSSCPVAIGNALIDMYKELQEELGNVQVEETKEEKTPIKDKQKKAGSPKCPECGSELGMVEGCMTCPNCGWSKCS